MTSIVVGHNHALSRSLPRATENRMGNHYMRIDGSRISHVLPRMHGRGLKFEALAIGIGNWPTANSRRRVTSLSRDAPI